MGQIKDGGVDRSASVDRVLKCSFNRDKDKHEWEWTMMGPDAVFS